MTQQVEIRSGQGHYAIAVQCGTNEPFMLQPGQSAVVNIWPGNELRVYEVGLARMDSVVVGRYLKFTKAT